MPTSNYESCIIKAKKQISRKFKYGIIRISLDNIIINESDALNKIEEIYENIIPLVENNVAIYLEYLPPSDSNNGSYVKLVKHKNTNLKLCYNLCRKNKALSGSYFIG